MSIFSILNYAAWALAAVFALLVGKDVVKVEKQRKEELKNGKTESDN